jgi:hypothetical protein
MTALSQISTKIKDDHWPQLGALLAGILTLWIIYLNNGRINNDGILYLEVARLFTEGAWKQGLALYPWPLYSLLIACVHQITQLDFQTSAYVLTVPFFALTSYALLTLVRLVGGGRNVMTAALLLLFASNYLIRDMLPLIVREHGFWAFHLLSVLFFVRYYTSKKLIDACLWGGFAVLASLFRLEGLAFLIFLPIVLLFEPNQPFHSYIKYFLKINIVLGLAATTLLLALACLPGLSLHDLGRLGEPVAILSNAYAQVNHIVHDKSQIMAESVLNNYLADYALTGIWLTLLSVIIGRTGGAIGWLQSALAGFAITSSKAVSRQIKAKPVLIWWASLGILNSVCILLSQFLLSARMTIPVGFVILMFGAFGLVKLHETWRYRQKNHGPWVWSYVITCAVLSIELVMTLIPYDSRKNYEKDGVAWALKNTPSNAKVFYEDGRLMYYAGLPFPDRMTGWQRIQANGGSIDDFDVVITHIHRKRPEELKQLIDNHHLILLKKFEDTAGNQLVILQKNH